MINHLRTLLLNHGPNMSPGSDSFLEEYVPADYAPFTWPTYLQQLRTLLFGANPSREMLNYRLAQFMVVMHACDLLDSVRYFDQRLALREDYSAAFTMTNQPSTANSVGETVLDIFGEAYTPDSTGVIRYEWLVEVTANTGTEVDVRVTHAGGITQEATYAFAQNLSAPVPLPASNFFCRVRAAAQVGDMWTVDYVSRPVFDISQLVTAVSSMPAVVIQLFGANPPEPLAAYYRLWQDTRIPYRLAGLLLAMGYQLELLRMKGS